MALYIKIEKNPDNPRTPDLLIEEGRLALRPGMRQVKFDETGLHVTEALAQIDQTRFELEAIARTAFEMGRAYARKNNKKPRVRPSLKKK